VIEDEIVHRERRLTGEARQGSLYEEISSDKRRLKEDETPCRVADDPVVVLNSRPKKPGNRVEEKTERTGTLVCWGWRRCQKRRQLRRGEV